MAVLIVSLCVITCSIQNVFKKQYNISGTGGEYTFSLVTALFALAFFLVTSKGIQFPLEILPYAIAFAICYAVATVTMVIAVKIGSLALTSLFLSYSLIIPTLNGLIFLHEKAGVNQFVGISALLISIFLVRGESKKSEKGKKINIKWVVNVTLCFVANGMCSVIQTSQKVKFDGRLDGNFMIISLILVVFMFVVATFVIEGKKFVPSLKSALILGAPCGIANGATNLLVMVSISFVSSSVFFPIISAGGIVLTFLFSLFLYKEKFIPRQIIGLIFGLLALVFLNI